MAKKKQQAVIETPAVETEEAKEELSLRQLRFIDEYLIDLNGTQAAIRAGYSKKGANVAAVRLLSNDTIYARVQQLVKERHQETIMDVDELLLEYSRIGRSDILNYVTFGGKDVVLRNSEELTESEARAISEVSEKVNKDGSKSISFKLHSKPHSLDSMAKYYKLFVDQHDVNVNLSWVDLMTDVHKRKDELKAKAKAKAKAEEADNCSTKT